MAQIFGRRGGNLIKLFVVLFDFVIINAVLVTFMKLTPIAVPAFITNHSRLTILLANLALILSQSEYSTILHTRSAKFVDTIKQSTKLICAHSTIMFLSMRLVSNNGGMFEFMLVYTLACLLITIFARYAELFVLRCYRKLGGNSTTVIFVGHDYANACIYNSIMNDASSGYRVLGYFANGTIKGTGDKFAKLGTIEDLNSQMEECLQVAENDKRELAEELAKCTNTKAKDFQLAGVQEIFCSLSHDENEEILKIMEFCDKNVIHFHYVPRQFGNYKLGLKAEYIGEYTLYTNHKEPLMEIRNFTIKRVFDITFSLLVCLCLLPFMPIIALIIKIQSPGPLFFKQDRTGSDGKTFKCIKFRSMHVNNDADSVQASKNDPRKFAFGNFMRKTNIDELPQFFNVLKGDMSIVGPRPHMLKHTEMYSQIVDKYMVRHFCKPGITGYAQVTGYRGETKEVWQMKERVKRDIWYIENWSFWLDIKIILLTAKTIIIPDKNAY